jgi:hypothetical protein
MSTNLRSFYANFQDPFGLVMRMLRSKDPAALSALLRAGLAVSVAPLDGALQPFERRRVRAAPPSRHAPIFIVGAPRSGTTLVYQALAHHLPVTYFSNLSALFPRAPLTASVLFERLFDGRRPDFHSFYGNTKGLAAPNDGFHVWNRWLGADRYRVPEALGDEAAQEMRGFFQAWMATFDRPLLNKNNRNTACIPLLASIFEDAWFIAVERDPVYVAQSLLFARERIQGSKQLGWGLGKSERAGAERPLGYVDDVCDQVLRVRAQCRRDLRGVAPERVVEVSYEAFCRDPAGVIAGVSRRVLGAGLDVEALRTELPPFRSTNRLQLETAEAERIRARIASA